ncbi:hypothetical protein MLD38_024943 [Melastoma candidum]|uniref:Uncharacterized protein n=1 Tax=Melastoma candidum TaxID=119954 RepID=A0ACB9NVG1_9MYRT|nr:hypothetical protein MLD38_024943 [Melastoma candidum]
MASLQTICYLLPPRHLAPVPRPGFKQGQLRLKLRPRRAPTTLASNDTSETDAVDAPAADVDNVGVKVALSMLKFYKREISPILPNSCRYVPTCSEYSMEAYKKYGVVKGTVLTAWRLCRCNPLGGSGFDPPRWFGEEVHIED